MSHQKRRYFVTGIIAVIPLWITWLVLAFLFKSISSAGAPVVEWLSKIINPRFEGVDKWLTDPVIQAIVSFLLVVFVIYFLGIVTTRVLGRKLVDYLEGLVDRVPLVKSIYGSVKKLTVVLQEKPAPGVERVVLIDFPSSEMKTVGLVTKVMTDAETGRQLAAVYVPTTPIPTSGYLEIVPVDRLTPTDWTIDQAMSFVISGGAVTPDRIVYDKKLSDKG